jgi:DNA-directed RNA polymerase subunit beta
MNPIDTINLRRNFGTVKIVIDNPHLIEVQKKSYNFFLHKNFQQKKESGLTEAFKSVFPITDFSGQSQLEFVDYSIGEPKYSVDECLVNGMSLDANIKVVVRLVTYDIDKENSVQSIRDIKEQEIFFGTLPLMTKTGTFVINGIERVIVSQLQRSPGVFFDHDSGKTHASGKLLYTSRIIPSRGSWIDFEFDAKDILYVRIDRRRKFLATILLKALGYEDILGIFYEHETFVFDGPLTYLKINPKTLLGQRASVDIINHETGEVLIKKNQKITKTLLKKLDELTIERIPIEDSDLIGKILAKDVIDPQTGEVLLSSNTEMNVKDLISIKEKGIAEIVTIFTVGMVDGVKVGLSMRDTLLHDKTKNREEALIEIYKRLRPSSPIIMEQVEKTFNNLFFNIESYDLSDVGRYKINRKLGLDFPSDMRILHPEDILATIKRLNRLKDESGNVDDIDHLGNRRVRSVGELVENQYRIGLVRMERSIKERLSLQEIDTIMPNEFINSKPVISSIKEFFSTSQLSQFMDQTNPLSETTHKRRLSALGPGGLTRERAGFEVRDVHTTHYGRICPIETPEGPNIGLIVSLSSFAKVNDYGFIETPYRIVKDRIVTDEIKYFSADMEEAETIAQATLKLGNNNYISEDLVTARRRGDFLIVPSEEITAVDVSPNQLVSISAGLIPFLENDDANRALMGSNMQRQAVPLLYTTSPIVGTGMERIVGRDSGMVVIAKRDGWIEDVDSTRVVVGYDEDEAEGLQVEVEIHKLTKFQKSNQTTTLNQRPLVKSGQRIKKGQVLVDGPSTDRGELALGRNIVVAFMPWRGYNFEDAIIVNERLIKNDVFTSIHIEKFEVEAKETKLGKEEITRDIPNLSEEVLRNLDESGIIRIGAEVKPGDILVGKVTPKGETMLSPEEKLLRAIFGEKAGDVKDTSLVVPPGIRGIVIDAKVFARKGTEKDVRSQAIEDMEIAMIQRDQADELHIMRRSAISKLSKILKGKRAALTITDSWGRTFVNEGQEITIELLNAIPFHRLRELIVEGKKRQDPQFLEIINWYEKEAERIRSFFESKIERLKKGDDLPPGVIKTVHVYIAMKRNLKVGDKMAGRHGNKGVVSIIVPEEDMPYFADGTNVDIILNPLGVPSRMNVGQIKEVHLGWALLNLGRQIGALARKGDIIGVKAKLALAYSKEELTGILNGLTDTDIKELGIRLEKGITAATPVFDGAKEDKIKELLQAAGFSETGQVTLYDGRSGEAFAEPVTVGVMHMIKLHHLVDEKIHARSTGPYSLVTQQPLGGKAQFGGQRLGEMEVWAMEAYGAAYALQEFLTVKSDDVAGRSRMYEKIVKGNNFLEAGLPESFNVLLKEMQALCIEMDLIE